MIKTCVSGMNVLFRGTEVVRMLSQQKHPFYSIRPKMMFGNVSENFGNPQHVKRCKTCVSRQNAQCRGTKVAKMVSQQKHLFYSIRPKMMFGSVSEHFDNLLHVKRCKTCVSGLNALFRCTKVVKHHFYSIGPKMIYGSVTEHFANHLHVKRWKLVFRAWMHYCGVLKLRSIHSTPLDPKWYMGVLRSTSPTLCK
jgi:hypothetical protein